VAHRAGLAQVLGTIRGRAEVSPKGVSIGLGAAHMCRYGRLLGPSIA
jgi:hypothetical protein